MGRAPRRIEERPGGHAQGTSQAHTKSRQPVTLLHSEHGERIDEAVTAER